jgi:hypothetical protein
VSCAGFSFWIHHSQTDARKPPGQGQTSQEFPLQPKPGLLYIGSIFIARNQNSALEQVPSIHPHKTKNPLAGVIPRFFLVFKG